MITVGDGDSAMQKISEMSPDVVLADVHMPGLSGYQICEIVRENPATKELPVVLLVGSFEPFDESEAARVGANAFLTKPFQSIRQLVSQVSDLMEARGCQKRMTETFHSKTRMRIFRHDGVDGGSETARLRRAAAPVVPDTSDIESLIPSKLSVRRSRKRREVPSSHFVDAGMDDEMIETSHAGDDR